MKQGEENNVDEVIVNSMIGMERRGNIEKEEELITLLE